MNGARAGEGIGEGDKRRRSGLHLISTPFSTMDCSGQSDACRRRRCACELNLFNSFLSPLFNERFPQLRPGDKCSQYSRNMMAIYGVQRYVEFDCCGCGHGLVKNVLGVHAANERVAEFIHVRALFVRRTVYVSCVFFLA